MKGKKLTEEEWTRPRALQRRSKVVPIVLAGVLAVGLAACGDDDPDPCSDRCGQVSGQDCGFGDGVSGGGGG